MIYSQNLTSLLVSPSESELHSKIRELQSLEEDESGALNQ
jgi:hypothetical protein